MLCKKLLGYSITVNLCISIEQYVLNLLKKKNSACSEKIIWTVLMKKNLPTIKHVKSGFYTEVLHRIVLAKKWFIIYLKFNTPANIILFKEQKIPIVRRTSFFTIISFRESHFRTSCNKNTHSHILCNVLCIILSCMFKDS